MSLDNSRGRVSGPRRAILAVLVGLFAIAAVYGVSRRVEPLAERKHALEVLYLPSGQFLAQATLGYRNLAADILWFKTIQYYGGYRMKENDLALFEHLVSVITDLDPQFTFAYLFGALIIAEDLGHFKEGIAVLEKGMANNPRDWWMPFEIGFLDYVYARDYDGAMKYFQEAAAMPGANERAARFAAFVAARAGHAETSIAMWEELARTSDNKYMKELAARYIEKLKAGESIIRR